jgi:hypothetical protein
MSIQRYCRGFKVNTFTETFFKTNAASAEEFIKTSEGIKYLRYNVE